MAIAAGGDVIFRGTMTGTVRELDPTESKRLSADVNAIVQSIVNEHLRGEVGFERLLTSILENEAEYNVSSIEEFPDLEKKEAWQLRGWAVISFVESGAKTVASFIAWVVSSIADKLFGRAWNHEAYGEAVVAHFASFWRSGLMIVSPDKAIASAFKHEKVTSEELGDVTHKEKTSDSEYSDLTEISRPVKYEYNLVIGRKDDASIEWGTVGDHSQMSVGDKIQLIGNVVSNPSPDVDSEELD